MLDDIAGDEDEAIINFSMAKARDFAWALATKLAAMNPEAQQKVIDEHNIIIAALGEKIINPGIIIGSIVDLIRTVETKNVVEILDTLNSGNGLSDEPAMPPVEAQSDSTSGIPPNRVYYFEIARVPGPESLPSASKAGPRYGVPPSV